MFRPLSVYKVDSRADGHNRDIKWEIDDKIKIIGYLTPKNQTRLTVVELYNNLISNPNKQRFEFFTEVPTLDGLGTISDGGKIEIETEPAETLTIGTNNFTYNKSKSPGTDSVEIRQHHLPMEQLKARGYIQSTTFKNFLKLAPRGPLKLKITDDGARFIAKGFENKGLLNITDDVVIYSDEISVEYRYDLGAIKKTMKKFPVKKNVEVVANDDLIRLRYEIGDGLGQLNYYQRSRR
jgi:hypothetical protein